MGCNSNGSLTDSRESNRIPHGELVEPRIIGLEAEKYSPMQYFRVISF